MTHEEIIIQLSQVIAEQQKKIANLEGLKNYYSMRTTELELKLTKLKNGK